MPIYRASLLSTIVRFAAVAGLTLGAVAHASAQSNKARVNRSPQEVFEAFRTASEKRDWRATLMYRTAESKQAAVVEAYIACIIKSDDPKVLDVLKKYQIDPTAVDLEYAKRKGEKKEVGTRNGDPQKRSEEPSPRTTTLPKRREKEPPLDTMLLYEIVTARITNVPDFFMDAKNASDGAETPRFERIENLTVQGESAVGRVKMSKVSELAVNQNPPVATRSIFSDQVRFRKINGSWVIDR